jgi:oxalate decarboxylase/phosphoglucose isomerase-like protein (cupin superfamily)
MLLNVSARLDVGPCYADTLYVTQCLNAGLEYALRSTKDQQIHYHEGVDEHEWYCSCVSNVIPV